MVILIGSILFFFIGEDFIDADDHLLLVLKETALMELALFSFYSMPFPLIRP